MSTHQGNYKEKIFLLNICALSLKICELYIFWDCKYQMINKYCLTSTSVFILESEWKKKQNCSKVWCRSKFIVDVWDSIVSGRDILENSECTWSDWVGPYGDGGRDGGERERKGTRHSSQEAKGSKREG